MKFARATIEDVVICQPKVFVDDRGCFFESFQQDHFENFVGFSVGFCQDNESQSNKGVLRGLHYQSAPYAQSKLVRVIKGRALDVVIDIRQGSSTFGKHIAIELSAENKIQLFVPRGFAHGFLVLEDETIFSYKVDSYYSPQHDRGILFSDPALSIDWGLPENELILSDKDKTNPLLNDAVDLFDYSIDYYT
ncbi:MAG: dTDP-4-dehydrorhamnose 3,5-epimerase [Rickettsiales bacterium]|nr:dTDP-4-dehydrorhamnose 3,5-epimerase [Rickettsiales bacterium]|tara:strand:+ start:1727 stop:2302 length:576 start_codon:yes stop_codon:yes gene_type:complete